jgi:hypothetical protein
MKAYASSLCFRLYMLYPICNNPNTLLGHLPNIHCPARSHSLQHLLPRHRRPAEVLPRMHEIPRNRNGRKAREDNAGIIHRARVDGQRNRHAEDDNRKADPDDTDAVDDVTQPLSQRIGRVADGLATPDKTDEDGDAVRGGQADGGDAGEGIEGGRGAEVDAPEDAVHKRRQSESVEGHVEGGVDAGPELVAGDGTVAGEGPRAARGRRERTDAGEHEDAEDEEEQAEATRRGARDGLEEEADGLRVGDLEQHLDVREDEEDGDEVDDARDAGCEDGEDDGAGDFALGVLNFLAEGGDHAVAGQGVCRCITVSHMVATRE